MITVQERIARANAYLAQKNGIDPDDAKYKKAKKDIAYAFEHGIDIKDVAQHKRKQCVKQTVTEQVPTVAEVEKALGRKLRNVSSLPKSCIKPIQNPLTEQRWKNLFELAEHLGVSTFLVRGRIAKKKPINGVYYEYEQ